VSAVGAPERRVLGFWALLTLGLNGIVGVGIFFAPAQLAQVLPGPASAWVFALTALLLAPVAWTYGRLGSAYPEDGGPFVWAREAFGERFAFGVGFVAFVSAVLSTAAIVSGLGEYLAPALGIDSNLGRSVFRIVAALLLAFVTLLGLRLSARVWSWLTVLKLVPLLLLVGAALPELLTRAMSPLGQASPTALLRAALLAVFPLQGFEIIPVPAGEARGSARTVLFATLLSLALAALLYVALQLACLRLGRALPSEPRPILVAGALHYRGGAARALFASGANVSAIGIAFGMFAMTPRYLAALGTERLFGTKLSHESRGVPRRALGVTTAAIVLLVSSSSLTRLFVLSSLAVLLQYAVSAVSLFRLAARRVRGLGVVDQWLAPLTLLAIAALAQAAAAAELLMLPAIIVGGFLLLRLRRRMAAVHRTR